MTRLIVHEIRKTCDKPGCDNEARYRVNYASMADYMAMTVCDKHIHWAEESLKQYIPTDR